MSGGTAWTCVASVADFALLLSLRGQLHNGASCWAAAGSRPPEGAFGVRLSQRGWDSASRRRPFEARDARITTRESTKDGCLSHGLSHVRQHEGRLRCVMTTGARAAGAERSRWHHRRKLAHKEHDHRLYAILRHKPSADYNGEIGRGRVAGYNSKMHGADWTEVVKKRSQPEDGGRRQVPRSDPHRRDLGGSWSTMVTANSTAGRRRLLDAVSTP